MTCMLHARTMTFILVFLLFSRRTKKHLITIIAFITLYSFRCFAHTGCSASVVIYLSWLACALWCDRDELNRNNNHFHVFSHGGNRLRTYFLSDARYIYSFETRNVSGTAAVHRTHVCCVWLYKTIRCCIIPSTNANNIFFFFFMATSSVRNFYF
jgi:hypothetical protein